MVQKFCCERLLGKKIFFAERTKSPVERIVNLFTSGAAFREEQKYTFLLLGTFCLQKKKRNFQNTPRTFRRAATPAG